MTASEYKDTQEATTLDHQATPGGGITGEPPVNPDDGDEGDDGDEEGGETTGEEDTLWAAARKAMREHAMEGDVEWLSGSAKQEGSADETETETMTEETTAAEEAVAEETTAAEETAPAKETAAAGNTDMIKETTAAEETTEAETTAPAEGTTAADRETEAEAETAETTKAAEPAEGSLTGRTESRPARETEEAGENTGMGAIEETALSLSRTERALTRAAILDPPDDGGMAEATEQAAEDTQVSGTDKEKGTEAETLTGTEEAPEQEADRAEPSQTASAKAGTEAPVPAKETGIMAPAKNTARKVTEETVQDKDGDDFLADMDLLLDGETDIWATASNATESTARAEHTIRRTGFFERVKETAENVWDYLTSLPGKGRKAMKAAEGAASYLRDTESFQPTQASYVTPPEPRIIDWTFVVYDHRTEGEIHFNKRDFDLQDDEGTLFDAYAAENGDGALEGAVYGLFAAQDIIHPDTDGNGDGDTGVVFQKGDLVAVATTDRNGDASFMVITEAPGSVYNYASGAIEHTDWYDTAPKNLHIERDASAAKEEDIERFIGHNPDNSEITAGDGMDLPGTEEGDNTFHYKRSTNQEYDSGMLENNRVTNNKVDTYREDETTGYYPISDNEQNNGNCWIGRPLILSKEGSSYYIRELSRSEGYELSVYGKDGTFITNREAFEAGGGEFISGEAHASSIAKDSLYGGNTFTVESSGTADGYILKASNIPEGAAFYTTVLESHWDDGVSHQEARPGTEPVYAQEGAQVTVGGKTWKAALGDTITYNGKTFQVNNVMTIPKSTRTAKPDNRSRVENPFLDVTKITPTENVMGDINTLFSKSGFRKVVNGCPWVGIPISNFNTQSAAAAINTTLFTDDWYSVFNAFEMLGTYIKDGTIYAAIGYCYRDARTNSAIYNPDNESVYVKIDVPYTVSGSTLSGFAYRSYDMSQCENVQKNGNGFVVSATVPNETASGSPEYAKEPMEGKLAFSIVPDDTIWTYAAGEQLLDNDGEPVVKPVIIYEDVTPTYVTEAVNREITDVSFQSAGNGSGTYTMTIPQEWIDHAGGKLDFRIIYDNGEGGSVSSKELYAHSHGVVGVTFPMGSADSYIEPLFLMYPGDQEIRQDAGTIASPTGVLERPIRQKVRIEKDIQTLPETKQVWYCLNCGYENQDGVTACGFCNRARSTEETRFIDYAHDTYVAVHSDNISAERDGGLYETAKDWLGSLLKGNSPDEEPESIGNFRFKAYLKSNLERLYRDEDGHVVWMDRNGNTMTPQYEDTNGDGNYDTFTWKYDTAYDGKTVDFPEKDKVSGDGNGDGTLADDAVLLSSNVQKIYTDVEHRTESMTTSARANNLWDTYADPQDGHRENAGQIEGYTTSERETRSEGDAVTTNASLYSYDGLARDRNRSDYLQDEQNHGYTRLLETQRIQIEDGTELIQP